MSIIEVKSVEEFDAVIKNNTYVVVDFFATWCGPCKAISPMLKKWAEKFTVADKLVFVKVDVDEISAIAARYNVTAMPTFLFFENGEPSKTHEKILGAVPAKLEKAIEGVSAAATAGKKEETPVSETTVSGGYATGENVNKRADWKMTLNP